MAYWGLAYSLGPNYNKPWERFDSKDLVTCVDRGHHAARRGLEVAKAIHVTPLEQALLSAIMVRFEHAEAGTDVKKLNMQNKKYAGKMKEVHDNFDDDIDISVLYADSMMQLNPWDLWNSLTGKPQSYAHTLHVRDVLENALNNYAGAWEHPGLLHFYVHFIEMSPEPELGIRAADALRPLIPDGGHALHMPTHLDAQVGDWRRSIASNQEATRADEKFYQEKGAMNFYTFYRLHNYHALIYASMFAGQQRTALDAVHRMESTLPEEVLRIESPPMADWIEHFMSVRAHVLIRFGMWQEIIDLPFPQDQVLYSFTTAIIHYAKGVAHAATGNIKMAEEQRELFKTAVALVPKSRKAYLSTAEQIMAIAMKMLDGEIEYRRGEYEVAFKSLQECIRLDDSLPYNEPWPWMQPPRHAYAALLLEQGRVQEAAAIYAADLGFDETLIRARRHPNNVWALQGYHECLIRMDRKTEAAVIEPALRLAKAGADVPVDRSCFCRLDVSQAPKFTGCSSGGGACCSKS